MNKLKDYFSRSSEYIWNKIGLGMQAKLIIIFIVIKIIPLVLLAVIAWLQIDDLAITLRQTAVEDSTEALNDIATENIERITTDIAYEVSDFLYGRDSDILFLADLAPTLENYTDFIENESGRVVEQGEWVLAEDGQSWVRADDYEPIPSTGGGISTNPENNDLDGFRYRDPDPFTYIEIPLYDEITYIDLAGNELIKVISPDSTKINYPLDNSLKNIANTDNTYIKAENYFSHLQDLEVGEIYVSDVIGAYIGTNLIGMYTPDNTAKAASDRGYAIEYKPEDQAFSGAENPIGQKYEGIVRWATPVADELGNITGYVTMALNFDHIIEMAEHITPMNERYTELSDAFAGNYAFIWDYQCRSIVHPRHHSIVGYDPATGEPAIPWLEASIYDEWQASGEENWYDYVQENVAEFDNQSREKAPAAALTQQSLVGLDGRYLNNAPQCTGWMDLSQDGGSGSFYILWSGLYKLTTTAAIPYYTGQYAPSEDNDFSRRGFGFVTVSAGLEDFTAPAVSMEERMSDTAASNLSDTLNQLSIATIAMVILIVVVAIWMATFLSGTINKLIKGISRFQSGERHFRFNTSVKDEFGTLADSLDALSDNIVDSVQNPLTIADLDLKIIYMNDLRLNLSNLSLDDVSGQDYDNFTLFPQNSIYCPLRALREGKESEVMYSPDQDKYFKSQATYLYNNDGEPIGYIIESIDMSTIIKQQIENERQRILLDTIFNASPDVIWYQNMEGKYLAVNPRFSSIPGLSVEECIGKKPSQILYPEFAAHSKEYFFETMAAGTAIFKTEKVKFFDGTEEVLDIVSTPLYDSSGEKIGLLGFARNVSGRDEIETELRQTQINLEQAVNEANLANEHKGEFLARMSHEIRTPMNAIIGITNIVLKKLEVLECDNDQMQLNEINGHVNQIEVSSQHLLSLLNDILDVSKIDAGKIELDPTEMDLSKLADTVAGIIRPRCQEKNINFITKFADFNPPIFNGDALRLRQVLINLLGNAVKFTPEAGQIEFTISNIEQKGNQVLVGFSCKDNGIGIEESALNTIFNPFEQATSSITRKHGGTGLGLTISASIVKLFGGEIKIKTKLGQGSEFSFDIWLEQIRANTHEEAISCTDETILAGKHILLVDDVDINRMIVVSMLEVYDAIIDEADDGEVALEMFSKSEPGYYDIILMDVNMPIMDGYQASQSIRELKRSDSEQVPIIALTANAFKDDIEKALEHGMNNHIAKPVDMDILMEVVCKHLQK